MKKLAFGLVLLALPLFASAQVVTFDTNLSYGSTGSEVSALQEFLVDQHLLASQFVTGNFYSITLAAVKAFQTAESITPVSGYFGPISRETANSIVAMEAPQSEGNAATTTQPVNLSQSTTTPSIPSYTPPQVIYVQVPEPSTQTQTFGSVEPVTPVSQAALLVTPTYTPITPGRGPGEEEPYGQYGFQVSVLDDNGNYVKDAAVTMTSDLPNDTEYTNDLDTPTKITEWDRGFDYVPLTPGNKTLTFTSGSLSQSIQLIVGTSTTNI